MSAARRPIVAGLIGWPVDHAKSPIIHNFWLSRCGIDGYYIRLPVRPGEVAKALRGLDALGFVGVQATMPHKRAALAAVDSLSLDAKTIGAVNTIVVRSGGELYGHNTDMAGFLEPLAGVDFTGRDVVVLGAGGAAAALAVGLARRRPASIRFVSRSEDSLARLLADIAPALEGIATHRLPWGERGAALAGAALVANATSLGMTGQPPLDLDLARLPEGAIVYDIVSNPHDTPLLKAARGRGLATYDGLHMLVGQARAAFELYYGVAAPYEHDADLRVLLTR